MNKIYKVIWSKAKNCYVVASELAKSHTKAPNSKMISKVVTAGVLACVVSCGAVFPVFAAGTDSYEAGGGNASGDYSVAIGKDTTADASQSYVIGYNSTVHAPSSAVFGLSSNVLGGGYSYIVGSNSTVFSNVKNVFVLGNNTTVSNGLPENWDSMTDAEKEAWANSLETTDIKEGVIALGNNISVSLDNKSPNSRSSTSAGTPEIEHVVAVGDNVVIGEENAIGIGHATKATALNTVAIGEDAQSIMEGGIAVGHSTRATGAFSNALGYLAQATGEGAGAFGQDAQAIGNFTTAFGRSTRASAESATAIGNTAHAVSQSSIAIGTSAIANGGANTNAVAIGRGATIGSDTQGYGETLAVGSGTNVQNAFGSALGSSANVTGQSGTALGYNASVTATNAVALGANSVASVADTVSVGSASVTRKIVNVTAGTANTDASTISQTGSQIGLSGNTLSLKTATGTVLNSVDLPTGNTYTAGDGLELDTNNEFSAKAGNGIVVGTNGISAKAGTNVTVDANGISVTGTGVIDNGNTGLISGDTLYNEVNVASNGNYIVAGDTTAQNLGKLDTAVKNVDNSSIKSMTANGTTVTYTKGDGTTGTFTTQDTNTEYTAGNGLELTGTEFKAKAGTNVTVDGDGISVIGNGTVASGNTGLVSGETVFGETRVASNGNYIQAANTASQNLVALDNALKNNANALDGKANVALDNITDAGKTVIKTNAKEAINVVGNGKATVNKTDVSGVDTYTVGVTVDGSVTNGDTGIVDGGTVYNALIAESRPVQDGNYITTANTAGANLTALDTAIKNASDGLDGKANTSLDNITNAGKTVVRDLAKESVKVVDGTNTTVTEGTDGTYKTYAVNVSSDGTVTSGNTGIVTGGTVYDALQTQKGEIEDALDGKANVALNNVTDAGHTVIKTDAKSAINVTGGTYATVDKTDVDGVDTYTVNVATDGQVAQGNTKLVTGGTVYTAINAETTARVNADNALSDRIGTVDTDGNYIKASTSADVSENLELLDDAIKDNADAITNLSTSKANVDLDNITTDGQTVVKNLAKQAIEVVSGTNAEVVKTEVNGKDVYIVNVATDGAIVDGDTKPVSGDTVYDFYISDSRPAADGTYISATNTVGANLTALDNQVGTNATDITGLKNLSNITDAGKTVIKTNAKEAINVTGGTYATVDKTDVDGVDTYTVNVATDGQVAQGNTKLVTGGTVHVALINQRTAIQRTMETLLAEKANVDLDNLSTAGEAEVNRIAKSSFAVNGDNDVTVQRNEHPVLHDLDVISISLKKDGQVEENNTGVVTGGTVYNAMNDAIADALTQYTTDVVDVSLSDKANKNLNNIDDAGITVVRNIAKQAVSVADGTNTTVSSETDASGNITYKVNTNVNGVVENGNTGIVSGGVVYDAIQDAISSSGTIEGKANIGLDNINDDGKTVIKTNAKESITVAGEGDITVTKTDDNGVDKYTVSVAKNGTITDGDDGIVTGGTVKTALDALRLDEKANVGLDNITADGVGVVRNIAKSAVTVADGENTTVTSTTDADGNISYKVKTNATGVIADGDTGLVDGGTVYSAIANSEAGTATALEGKANISLDNIVDSGKEVIKTNAKEAITVDGSDDVTVTKTSPNGVDTYTVSVNKNGTVTDGNTNLVTGGTVYSAIQSAVSASETGTDAKLDGKANVSLDNITDDGKTVIQNATNIVSGDGIISVTPTTENGVKTYTVSANISADGTVADGNTGLVSGGTMYTELRPADGNYVRQVDTTAQNLTALDTALNDVSGRVDTVETDITNLKDLSNITDNGRTVIRNVAKDAVKVINGTHTTVTEGTDGDAKTYAVNVAVDGAIETGNTGLVSGGAVYDYVQSAIESGVSNVAIADGYNTTVTSSTEGNLKTYRIKANATGTIADNDTGLVDGNTVYDALQDTITTVNSSINTAKTDVLDSVANDLTGKANIALDNIDDNGKVVVKDLALQSVQFANGDHTQVVNETVDHVRTTKVNVLTDGTVTEGNTGVVSGGTVYNAIDNAKIEANNYTDSAFADAAHKSLNNLNDDGQMVLRDSAIDAVKIVNGQHTTVGYEDKTAGREYHVDVNSDGLVEYNNNGLVTGGTVFDALATYNANILTLMDGYLDTKANINLDNLNDSGKSRVRSLAQSAVKVVPGQNTNVVIGSDGTYLTYAVNVNGDGAVTSDNNGLLKGSTVYNEVHTGDGNYIASSNSASQNLTALDTSLKELSDKVDNIPSGGSDANAVHYDGTDKDIVTMAGADGTTITNVKAGVNDTDAVNVSQLSALATKSELSDAKSELEGRISVTEDLLSGDWGGQTVKEKIDANTSAINNVSDRVTTVEGTVGEHTNAINNLQGDVSTLTTNVNTLGGRVDDVESAVAGKANIDLDNISDNGAVRIADIAKGSVNIVSGDNNIVVEKTDVGGKDIYNVSVNTNGIVAEGDTGIVTGGTVYDAIQNIETKQPHYYSVNETHRDETTYNNGGATGEDALAIGIGSKAEGDASVALGRSNIVTGYNSTAVGIGQTVAGNRSGAFGDPNTVNGDGSYVMGNDNTIDGDDTFVMGSDVTATGDNSVVLGKGSDGSQSNVVSVGATDAERRIVHVNDGVDDTDAVNVRQLKTAKSELEGRVKVTEDLLTGDWGGETVKDKIDKNTNDINTLRDNMGNKANVDASNIDVDKFTDKLGTGDVTEGNNGLVKGGVVYDAIQKIRDTNITLSPDGTTLNVGKGNDASFVDFTNSNGEGRVLQGIVTDPNNPNSAANVGYVDAVGQNIINGVNNGLSKLDSKVNKVGAGAAALASLAPLPFDEDQRWSVSAAVGTYHGEQAGALGVFYKPADNVMLNVRGSFGNGENMAGAGVTIGLEKKTSAGISKVAMAKAMNAQAQEISMQKEQIAEQQRMLEMQQAQIEQLKRIVQEVVAKK